MFGRLTVTAFVTERGGPPRLRCVCSCGGETTVCWGSLRSGHTKSCGCFRKERTAALAYKHGLKYSLLYGIWQAIKNRCYNKRADNYGRYGARGITVCDEWRNEFLPFYAWATNNGYAEGLQLDRKDNDECYSPENCRFLTNVMNSHNTRLLRQGNSTGFRGVHLKGKVFVAQVQSSLGPHLWKEGFKTAEEAAKYRDAHCIQHGIPLPLNFKGEQPYV